LEFQDTEDTVKLVVTTKLEEVLQVETLILVLLVVDPPVVILVDIHLLVEILTLDKFKKIKFGSSHSKTNQNSRKFPIGQLTKMMNKVFFVLFLLFSVYICAPVVCGNTNALSEEINEEMVFGRKTPKVQPKKKPFSKQEQVRNAINIVRKNRPKYEPKNRITQRFINKKEFPCDPRHTCRYKCMQCPDSYKALYLNLKSWAPFHKREIRKVWSEKCGGRLSAEEFILIQRKLHPLVNINYLRNIFSKIADEYNNLCHGGHALDIAGINHLKDIFTKEIIAKFGTTSELLERLLGERMLDQLIAHLKSKKFEHCSCHVFFDALGKSYKDSKIGQSLNEQCARKCGFSRNIMDFDQYILEFEE
jgi:hypothetical protein